MTSLIEWLLVIGIIGLIIAVFFLFIRHDAAFAHSNPLGRHLNFDHYHMDTIIKMLYFFTLIANTLIAIVFMAYVNDRSASSGENFLVSLMIGVLAFAVLQFLSRMIHEAIIMYVNMAQDVKGIREAYGYKRVAAHVPENPAPVQQDATPKPSFAERASAVRNAASRAASAVAEGLADNRERQVVAVSANAQTVPVKMPERATKHVDPNTSWTCGTCGTLIHSGKFCPKCGSPRPRA